MSQEKVDRNEKMYADRVNGMSYYALSDKYHIRHPNVIRIIKRMQERKENKENHE